MNASTVVAWLICLALAFFAAALALVNRYELLQVEKKLQEMPAAERLQRSITDTDTLEQMRDSLQRMEQNLERMAGEGQTAGGTDQPSSSGHILHQ